MKLLKSMTPEELGAFMEDHSDEFNVVKVRPQLMSLVTGKNFEKCLISATQQSFPGLGVDTLQEAAQILFTAGFDLALRPLTGVATINGQLDSQTPVALWEKLCTEVIGPLFDGQVIALMEHIPSGQQLTTVNMSEQLREYRLQSGVNPDRPLGEELMRVYQVT